MRRYVVDDSCIDSKHVIFKDESFHHIFSVCRQEMGYKFEVLNSRGTAFLVEVISLEKKSAVGQILSSRQLPQPQPPFVHLILCLPKWSTVETILEKSVELGLKSVQIVTSDFSFLRNPRDVSVSRFERFQKIIQSATAQSARGDQLELPQVVGLEQFLSSFNPTAKKMGLFLYEGASSQTLKEHLSSVTLKDFESISVFIGSEGGFSAQEVELFKAKGLLSLSLGEQVLRVETACLSVGAILKYELG